MAGSLPDQLLDDARQSWVAGARGKAVALLRSHVARYPGDERGWARLVGLLDESGRRDGAISVLRCGLQHLQDPSMRARLLAYLGMLLNQRLAFEEAAAAFRESIRQWGATSRNAVPSYVALGVVYAQLGADIAGAECYRTALSLEPTHSEARLDLGVLLRGTAPQESESWLRSVADTSGLAARRTRELALVLAAQGAIDRALREIELLVGRPTKSLSHEYHAYLLLLGDRPNEACEAMRRAADVEALHPVGIWSAMRAYEQLGWAEDAGRMRAGLQTAERGSPIRYWELLRVLWEVGNREDAHRLMAHLLEASPDHPYTTWIRSRRPIDLPRKGGLRGSVLEDGDIVSPTNESWDAGK